ncbi:folliculin-interacting protein 2 [Coccinella septempunctata]|uniref:folliculin-interacting protein 2 n=1 Tax=Coccinella septempunctata TaxID=41139 RepID=UPI001D08D9EC|nr:folliculin-interacting protein 2 [Coccinella septempunctata]
MALFNKLFSPRKNNPSNQDNVSGKHFGFTKEQVRVVLFRECDFRGRKLLFDSTAVKKIQINSSLGTGDSSSDEKDQFGSFAEISNGFGYMYIKPPTDSSHLAEMIFGLVAMSYRGSYFKIHNLESPSRLMLTQVFPSPKYVHRRKSSASSHGNAGLSNQSLEQSLCLDDSGTSISDYLSVHSTASDTFLICKPSIPLEVPQKFSGSSSSVVCDSGVYGDRSCSSFDGSRQFSMIPFWESMPVKGSATSFSNSTLYKRWLRSSSLEYSVNSSNSSMEETFTKSHQRTSKLGLAFIIHLTNGQEESQIQFFMEHIALLESMLWRARQATEIAYLKPANFLSVLMKMVNLSSVWLTNLLSSPLLPLNLWTMLCNKSDNNFDCDNNNSIKCDVYNSKETLNSLRSILNNSNGGLFNSFNGDNVNLLSDNQSERYEFSFLNITKMIKNEWDYFNSKLFGHCTGNNLAENFVQEFCELLEAIDIKDTNFFMSTLLTAVLTHHLGWVATCLPQEKDDQIFFNFDLTFNPLWGQLCDLYGAVGHPTKMAQTIIMGEKKKDVIAKIINCLTYFIRCSELERKNSIRSTIDIDNKTADYICHKNSCIPKENFKKYKDHLREMLDSNKSKNNINNNEFSSSRNFPEKFENRLRKGLCKSKKTQYNLRNLDEECVENKIFETTNSKLRENSKCMNLKEMDNLVETYPFNSLMTNCDMKIEVEKENVVFVLGDNEELVNIKKGESSRKKMKISKEDKIKSDKTVEKSDSMKKNSVPNFLESIFKKYETFEEEFSKSIFKDEDFIKYETDTSIKPSTSWASLQQAEEEDIAREAEAKLNIENYPVSPLEKPFVRSRSMPPESKGETVKDEVKAKYRYSGVKFSLHQYPQVVTNYMRSKNLEMSNLSFSEITKRFDQISLENEEDYSDYPQYEINSDEMEALQTPSNASELEFTSEITVDMSKHRHARESSEKPVPMKTHIPNDYKGVDKDWIVEDDCFSKCKEMPTEDISKMRIIYFPMPKSEISSTVKESIPYPLSLMRGLNDNYIPDLVLQGTSAPKKDWEATLKNELSLSSQHCLLDQPLDEAVAIIADTDTWEVHLVSSHTYVIDKNSSGVKIGMSQLIASMLDSLLKMWKLQVPPHLCMMHIEQRLQALCVTSRAVAQLLLATEFCSMEFLTSTLHLEVNDVPLLLAVASTFSPQVTQKYGISFH